MPEGMDKPAERLARDYHMSVLLGEIYLLLSYIQGVPEKRLTKYFGENAQRVQERDDAPVPPTWDLAYFLGRLAAIESSGPDFDPNAITQAGVKPPTAPPNPAATTTEIKADADPGSSALPPSKLDPGPNTADLAFLIWTQDFLAAVAAPVTVETLMVTQAFRVARMRSVLSELSGAVRNLLRSTAPPPADRGAILAPRPSPFDPEVTLAAKHATLQAYGKRLATRVSRLSWLTAAIIFFTVWSSALVYTGRVLVRENVTLQTAYKEIAGRIALADKDERVTPHRGVHEGHGRQRGSRDLLPERLLL